MDKQSMLEVSDAQALTLSLAARYLGLRGEAEPAMALLLQKAYGLMREAAWPRHRLVRQAVTLGEGTWVSIDGLPSLESQSLHALLGGCEACYGLLATLGMELDLAIRRLLVQDAALGMAVGACGSAYIDVYLDEVLAREAQGLEKRGEGLTRRFSPGYGDVPLSLQPDLLALCGARHMGIRLTQGGLMLPEKSVSALVGIRGPGGVEGDGGPGACGACDKRDCIYREEKP